ncbi:hypothetical protein LTR56_015414 [Elasticomyces elasticus]|nr:hypothetical protein LTR22_023492 [Elasticomyces elasticus]KAK3634207.1 hypothetical protein LTR56_015414 [Elasticomyces elasticus]KAK4912704.1 hypothetical protein LTR49_018877 [Elasticomyces elasticus]KAK5761820.1 hypothetical protein LTS12_008075 [Elasticomyces elasticus]
MDTSPFGKLSAELRVAIYKLVISQPSAVTMRHDGVQKCFRPDAGHGPDAIMFAVTRVCRLFTTETAGLVYKLNVFRFEITNVNNPLAGLDQFQSLLSTEDAQLLRPVLVLPLAMGYGTVGFRPPAQTDDHREAYDTLPQCLDALLTEFGDDSSRSLRIHLDCSVGYRGYAGNASVKIGLSVELDLQNFTATACDELDSPNQLDTLDTLIMTWDHPEAARILYVGNSELYGFLNHFGASKTFLKDHQQSLSSL